jgi:hypothetical protein
MIKAIPGSSNGRTLGSEPGNLRSNRSPGARKNSAKAGQGDTMRKVVLNIFKTEEGEYHMVLQAGENPEPKSLGTIVYRDEMEVDSKDTEDIRKATRQLKEKVKNWACEQGIKFIENLDINPYE